MIVRLGARRVAPARGGVPGRDNKKGASGAPFSLSFSHARPLSLSLSAPPGLVDVVLSYCHCCPADHTLDAEVPFYAARGLGIISASPLSMGLLTPQGPPPWHPAPDALKAAAKAAVAAVTAAGCDAPALALRDALATPGVATHLIGLSSRAQVRAAVAAATAEATPAEVAALKEMRAILAPVAGMTWASGRAENS